MEQDSFKWLKFRLLLAALRCYRWVDRVPDGNPVAVPTVIDGRVEETVCSTNAIREMEHRRIDLEPIEELAEKLERDSEGRADRETCRLIVRQQRKDLVDHNVAAAILELIEARWVSPVIGSATMPRKYPLIRVTDHYLRMLQCLEPREGQHPLVDWDKMQKYLVCGCIEYGGVESAPAADASEQAESFNNVAADQACMLGMGVDGRLHVNDRVLLYGKMAKRRAVTVRSREGRLLLALVQGKPKPAALDDTVTSHLRQALKALSVSLLGRGRDLTLHPQLKISEGLKAVLKERGPE